MCKTIFECGGRKGTICLFFIISLSSLSVRAEISYVNLYHNGTYVQNGNGNSLVDTGLYVTAGLFSTAPNEFASASMTYPGVGSPATLSSTADPVFLIYYSSLFPDQGSLDTGFPTGTYQFNAGTDSTSIGYTTNYYPLTIPYLSGTDFSAIQNLNPVDAFTFDFSPFTTGGQADESYIFFTVFDLTQNVLAFNGGVLSPSTSQLTMPGNTLTNGHDYRYELIFSNRDIVPSPGANFDGQLGFDFRTTGSFSTAVPEPTSGMLLAIFLGLSFAVRQRRVRPAGSPMR